MTKVAAIQMASGPNVHANLLEADRLITRAVEDGAGLVVLPENFAIMGLVESDKLNVQEKMGHGTIQDFLSTQAKKNGIWLVGGTIPLEGSNPSRVRAASLLYNDQGEVVARYDKIHLFDVQLEENGENYTESETIEPGDSVVVVDTPFGKLGMAVCYDLRFPELFRQMLDQGMEILVVPSAFTALTGNAHWEVLVRARAIENLCFVVAAAQGGYHASGRHTHGGSMIVEPWGMVLNSLAQGPGVVGAELDHSRLRNTRHNFPSIDHRIFKCGNGL